MPCEKELVKLIPKIYRHQAEEVGLFYFVKAQLQLFPNLSVEQSVRNFLKLNNISPDEWDTDSAKVTYYRLQNAFYGK